MRLSRFFLFLMALVIGSAGLVDLAEAQRSGRGGGGRQGKKNMTAEQRQARRERRQQGKQKLTKEERQARRQGRGQLLEGRFDQLNLTKEQQTQIKALRQKYADQAKADNGQRPSAEQLQQRHREQQAGLTKILTADQFAKLEQLRAEQGEKGKKGERAGHRGARGARRGRAAPEATGGQEQ